jgi:chitin synthase
VPCVAGEFGAALGTLFDTLADAQAWFVLCVRPNDAQLPYQLEGRSVKGQVRALGLAEVAKHAATVFEVGMMPRKFGDRYREPLAQLGEAEGEPREIGLRRRTSCKAARR